MNRLFIDNIEFTEFVEGLDTLQVFFSLDETTRTVNYTSTSGLTIAGEAYDYVNAIFFQECDWDRKLNVIIETKACSTTYNFQLLYKGVKHNPDCTIEMNLVNNDEDVRCFRDLESTIFWRKNNQLDQEFLDYDNHPRVHYCIERMGLINRLLAIVRVIIGPILAAGGIFEDIINFVGDIFGGKDIDLPSLDNFDSFFSGCGHYNVSPLVRKIFTYHLEKCGATLSSSILTQDPYNRLALYMGQYVEGYDDDTPVTEGKLSEDQAANITPVQLLQKLRPVFNADFRFKGGVLYFERIDYFDTFFGGTIDLTSYEFEYEYDEPELYAFGRFEYTNDSFDQEGNKLSRHYNDIIDWNNPPNDTQTGEYTNILEFSPASFLFDQAALQSKELGTFRVEMDQFRSGVPSGLIIQFGNKGDRRNKPDMIVTNHQVSQLRLLVLEENYNWRDASTIRRQVSIQGTGVAALPTYHYNYPLYFDELYPEKELYQRFHYLTDPRNRENVYYLIESIETPLECDSVGLIVENGIDLQLETSIGNGKAEEIIIDYGRLSITYNKIRIPCSQ